MIEYNKDEIKNSLLIEEIYEVLEELGAEPQYTSYGILSLTICHNAAHSGSRKLYYYKNTKLFHCYTGCDSFDIFDLIIKTKKIQENKDYSLIQSLLFIVNKFNKINFAIKKEFESKDLEDWTYINNYFENKEIEIQNFKNFSLPTLNSNILNNFFYPRIIPWEKENISSDTIKRNFIGYYPSDEQITIPHFNINNELIGIRGRSLIKEDAERFGKYRPLYINGILYNHPLRYNLYNLNNSKKNIIKSKCAIVFEGEKSPLQYQSLFGEENDITVACCGSHISDYQIWLLKQLGVRDLTIAFDRQFQEVGDEEYEHLKKEILKINNKYKNEINLYFIFDKNKITSYKASPIDEGTDKFLTLFKERIKL